MAKKTYYEEELIKVLNKPKKNTKISKNFIETCTSNITDDPK
jgi:hypothetical protein